MEGRYSDSPYIDSVWHGVTGDNYTAVCPADEHWNIMFTRTRGVTSAIVEGPLTKALAKFRAESAEFLVIRFKLGVFMSYLPVGDFRDGAGGVLPDASTKSTWIHGAAWQLPDYENAETFVDWLVRDGALLHDPVVSTVMEARTPDVSVRTLRRRFQTATGITHGTARQIARARQAVSLLENGVPILDAVYEAGYADQPHMTRALKRFFGQTPAQILRTSP